MKKLYELEMNQHFMHRGCEYVRGEYWLVGRARVYAVRLASRPDMEPVTLWANTRVTPL